MSLFNTLKRNPFLRGLYNLLDSYFGVWKCRLGHADKTAVLIPPMTITGRKNVYMYEHSHIDGHAHILTTRARFVMGKWSGAAVGLTVITGDHHHIPGKWSKTVGQLEKPAHLDRDVVVGEDVIISANVTLLAGVHIGRGAIIGAGAIVTKSVPPYAIAAGVPAKVVGFKFTPDEVRSHEEALYPADQRTDMEAFQQLYDRVMEEKRRKKAAEND